MHYYVFKDVLKYVAGRFFMPSLSGLYINDEMFRLGEDEKEYHTPHSPKLSFIQNYFLSQTGLMPLYLLREDCGEPKLAQLYQIVSEQCTVAGLEIPQICVSNHSMLNAGSLLMGEKTLVFTSGMINTLSADQLRPVVAHELSHVKNVTRDTAVIYSSLIAGWGVATITGVKLWQTARDKVKTGVEKVKTAAVTVGTYFLGICGIHLARNAYQRWIEKNADRDAVNQTGQGGHFISALNTITAENDRRSESDIHQTIEDKVPTILLDHPKTKERVRFINDVQSEYDRKHKATQTSF